MGDSRSRTLTNVIEQMLRREAADIRWKIERRPYNQSYNAKDHIWIYFKPTRLDARNNIYLTLPDVEYPVLTHLWNSRFQAPYEWLRYAIKTKLSFIIICYALEMNLRYSNKRFRPLF